MQTLSFFDEETPRITPKLSKKPPMLPLSHSAVKNSQKSAAKGNVSFPSFFLILSFIYMYIKFIFIIVCLSPFFRILLLLFVLVQGSFLIKSELKLKNLMLSIIPSWKKRG